MCELIYLMNWLGSADALDAKEEQKDNALFGRWSVSVSAIDHKSIVPKGVYEVSNLTEGVSAFLQARNVAEFSGTSSIELNHLALLAIASFKAGLEAKGLMIAQQLLSKDESAFGCLLPHLQAGDSKLLTTDQGVSYAAKKNIFLHSLLKLDEWQCLVEDTREIVAVVDWSAIDKKPWSDFKQTYMLNTFHELLGLGYLALRALEAGNAASARKYLAECVGIDVPDGKDQRHYYQAKALYMAFVAIMLKGHHFPYEDFIDRGFYYIGNKVGYYTSFGKGRDIRCEEDKQAALLAMRSNCKALDPQIGWLLDKVLS